MSKDKSPLQFTDPSTGEKLSVKKIERKETDGKPRGTGLTPATSDQLSKLAEKFKK